MQGGVDTDPWMYDGHNMITIHAHTTNELHFNRLTALRIVQEQQSSPHLRQQRKWSRGWPREVAQTMALHSVPAT